MVLETILPLCDTRNHKMLLISIVLSRISCTHDLSEKMGCEKLQTRQVRAKTGGDSFGTIGRCQAFFGHD
jgi:hypothetical protein